MIEEDVQVALIESERGKRYEKTWNDLVEPFFVRKQEELFAAFKLAPVRDDEALVKIKMQSCALDALKDEFQHFIDTGKLATQTLREKGEIE